MSWICTGCHKAVDPQHVTYAELHDPRQGGCGAPVKALEVKSRYTAVEEGPYTVIQDGSEWLAQEDVVDRLNEADTLATRLAEVERERDALREELRFTVPLLEAREKQARECAHYDDPDSIKHAQFWRYRLDTATALLGKENTDGH